MKHSVTLFITLLMTVLGAYGSDTDTVALGTIETEAPLRAGFKTNALLDAALIPNLGLEVNLGHKTSIAGSWAYAWWSKQKKHKFWQLSSGRLEIRKYFGKASDSKILTGLHMGAFGSMFTGDMMLGKTGRQFGRWNWACGLAFGYSLPIKRNFNIDFSVDLGYIHGRMTKYQWRCDQYQCISQGLRRWVGPAGLDISLVWIVGDDLCPCIQR